MAEMKDREGTIVSNVQVAKDIYKAVIAFDDLPEGIKGGQFVHIKLTDNSHVLRRPFCICDFDCKAKTVTVCYAVVGEGTKELAGYEKGTRVKAMLPLGNGFTPDESMKKIVLLGGGMGSAVLPAIPRAEKVSSRIFLPKIWLSSSPTLYSVADPKLCTRRSKKR